MASESSTRLWRVYKASGRPWPVVCDDDVIDYMVMEAVAVKAGKEDEKEREKQKRESWKENKDHLKQYQ